MNKALSSALFAGGILLVTFGVAAMDSLSSEVSRFLNGARTDKAVWISAGGVVLLVGGVVATWRLRSDG
jgi:hypothetical protein